MSQNGIPQPGAGEVGQLVKVLAAKSDDLSVIPHDSPDGRRKGIDSTKLSSDLWAFPHHH